MGLLWKVWGFFPGACIGWVVVFELGKNGGSELGFWDGRVLRKIVGAMDGLPIGTWYGRLLGSFKCFIDGAVVGKCLCLCCCIGYSHM